MTQSNGITSIVNYPRRLLVAALSSYYGSALCSCWSGDDALLCLGGEDDALSIIDTYRWEVVGRGEGHEGFVTSVYMRPMLEPGVYRVVSAGEDGRLLFWEWTHPARRKRPQPSASFIPLRPYPPLQSLLRFQPLASNLPHPSPITALTGSHSYVARRREYRAAYHLQCDVMEVQAEEGVTAEEEGDAADGVGEFIVTAGWDWSIKVWMGEKGGAAAAVASAAALAAAAAGGSGLGQRGASGRRRGKRLSLRVIEPSPVMRGRALLDGQRGLDGNTGGFSVEVSELSTSVGARRALAVSPLSLSLSLAGLEAGTD